MEFAKVTAGVKKNKKKQVKDELDRIKQAEKKKRRLEKALATSAAIRSELEKKKLRKKEEQEKLDEEGAAIAESVALKVLLGEDSDESTNKILLKKDEGLALWDHAATNIDIIVGGRHSLVHYYNDFSKYSCENWVNSNLMGSSGQSLYPQYYFGEECWDIGLSASHIAARAVSSLNIADDDARVDAHLFSSILRG